MKAICNKGICVFLFLSLLMSATMVNAQRVITASGKYITKNIKVTRFDQIYLKGRIYAVPGSIQSTNCRIG